MNLSMRKFWIHSPCLHYVARLGQLEGINDAVWQIPHDVCAKDWAYLKFIYVLTDLGF